MRSASEPVSHIAARASDFAQRLAGGGTAVVALRDLDELVVHALKEHSELQREYAEGAGLAWIAVPADLKPVGDRVQVREWEDYWRSAYRDVESAEEGWLLANLDPEDGMGDESLRDMRRRYLAEQGQVPGWVCESLAAESRPHRLHFLFRVYQCAPNSWTREEPHWLVVHPLVARALLEHQADEALLDSLLGRWDSDRFRDASDRGDRFNEASSVLFDWLLEHEAQWARGERRLVSDLLRVRECLRLSGGYAHVSEGAMRLQGGIRAIASDQSHWLGSVMEASLERIRSDIR